ncbi:MAG TPA: hypothetical protein VH560_03765 [Polyangia bacterium]|jgi:hypothetical protein|nr:hypothetical protein [Polyangia bacterium]
MTSVSTPDRSPRPVLGSVSDLARASTLVLRSFPATSVGVVAVMLLPALIELPHPRTSDDSGGVMRALWILMFCTGLSVGARGLMQSARAEMLAFLETRPLRASTKAIVTLPFMFMAATFVAVVALIGHWGLAKSLAVFGCA